jgi:hypothetical protein
LPTAITSFEDITAQIKAPAGIKVDSGGVDKGIDNYHIDVEISALLTLRIKESIDENLKRLMAGKALVSGNSELMHEVRDTYTDLMKVTLHRTKTDLHKNDIQVLQFAVIKFVIEEVRGAVDRYGDQLEETLGQQQFSGSRSLLATQGRMGWYRKHNSEFLYRLTRLYLRQIQREENNQLKSLREQVLGEFAQAPNVLCNPLLFGRTPKDPIMLLDYYAVWPGVGAQFEKMNEALEASFQKHLGDRPFIPLKSDEKLSSAQSEVYDELGGLFAAQNLLGPSEDQKTSIEERFSWLDHPGNIRLLFDPKVHERYLAQEGLGISGAWGLKSDVKKLQKVMRELQKALGDSKAIKMSLASYVLREKLTQQDLDLVEIEDALSLVAGIDSRKTQQVVDLTQEGGAALQAKIEECMKEFDGLYREQPEDLFLRFLSDYCRYRMHLKYYRFAHRMFNRVSVITEPQKIQLAKAGGNLYRLLCADEIKEVGADEQPEIVHHTILKADVRGSTTVTAELTKQGLNPASYFSLRFFNPINEHLATYGAVKVFIEGDAVILGVYEFGNAPDEWFSVSRACGIAKEILDIVTSKNANSKQTGLPTLEVGIGICYSDDRPLFLFDDNRPIMISSAIGDADRMSSCSWKLRGKYESGNFNVAALQIADGDQQKGEKGQELIRYNVNGLVLDQPAFEKLQTEVHFRRMKAKSGETEETFYVGQYPDVLGKQRDLVVRQGQVGIWTGSAVDMTTDTGQVYYEVLPNSKFAHQIVDLARKKSS